MPKLPALLLTSVLLPCGVTCHIGLTYGNFLEIEREVNSGITLKAGDKAEQTISGEVISTEKNKLLSIAVKQWDLEDDNGIMPITIENIMKLPLEDGEVLYNAVSELYRKKTTDETKKK